MSITLVSHGASDPGDEEMYTLLTPTYNRPQFVERFLHYYLRAEMKRPIVVADGSSPEVIERNAATIAAYRGKGLDVVHFIPQNPSCIPGINIGFCERLNQAMSQVHTPLVHIVADDDLCSIEFLENAAAFLQSNPDYSTVAGMNCGVYPVDNRTSVEAYGAVGRMDLVPNPSARREASAGERLTRTTPNALSVFWTMHRRENFLEFSRAATSLVHDIGALPPETVDPRVASLALDYLYGFLLNHLALAQGKVHSIPHVVMANHYHAGNWGASITREVTHGEVLMAPQWPMWGETIVSVLAQAIGRSDRLPEDQARNLAQAVLWRHLSFQLTRVSNRRLGNLFPAAVYQRSGPVRDRLRKLPGLTHLVRSIRGAVSSARRRKRVSTDSVSDLALIRSVIESAPLVAIEESCSQKAAGQ